MLAQSLYDPAGLPASYQSDIPDPSATLLLLELQRAWPHLRPTTKARVLDLGYTPDGGAQSRPTLSGQEMVAESEHFRAHYTLTGADAIAATDSDNNDRPDYVDAR